MGVARAADVAQRRSGGTRHQFGVLQLHDNSDRNRHIHVQSPLRDVGRQISLVFDLDGHLEEVVSDFGGTEVANDDPRTHLGEPQHPRHVQLDLTLEQMWRRVLTGELALPTADLHAAELRVIVRRPVGKSLTAKLLVVPAKPLGVGDVPIPVIVSSEPTPKLGHESHHAKIPIRPRDQRAMAVYPRVAVTGNHRLSGRGVVLARQLLDETLIWEVEVVPRRGGRQTIDKPAGGVAVEDTGDVTVRLDEIQRGARLRLRQRKRPRTTLL